jgi:hypothetical protein
MVTKEYQVFNEDDTKKTVFVYRDFYTYSGANVWWDMPKEFEFKNGMRTREIPSTKLAASVPEQMLSKRDAEYWGKLFYE